MLDAASNGGMHIYNEATQVYRTKELRLVNKSMKIDKITKKEIL